MNFDPGPAGFAWPDDKDLMNVAIVENSRLSETALGAISFGDSKAVCNIRSISAFGAALDVVADKEVPDEFDLTINPSGGQHRCVVIWRKEKRLAVAFC
jgi:hypothetical protein